MSAEKRLKELNLQLAPVPPPVANYVNAVRTGNLLFLAGKGPASARELPANAIVIADELLPSQLAALSRMR